MESENRRARGRDARRRGGRRRPRPALVTQAGRFVTCNGVSSHIRCRPAPGCRTLAGGKFRGPRFFLKQDGGKAHLLDAMMISAVVGERYFERSKFEVPPRLTLCRAVR